MKTFIRLWLLLAALLCAREAAGQAETQKSAKRFVVTEHGAVGDGKTTNTRAIQETIDSCAAGGGGVVVVPKGTFLTGAIFFKQGVDLEVEKEGVLKGTTRLKDYKLVQTRWEGEERIWISALVNAFGMDGFRMSGEGTIDGSGEVWAASRGRRGGRGARGASGAARAGAPAANPADAPELGPKGGLPPTPAGQVSPADDFRAPRLPGYGRPRLVAIQNCTNPVVENLHFKNEASWCLFALYSTNVTIRNVAIRAAHTIPSSDGIDIDSCKKVLISGASIDCNDDCISIKSGKDEDGLRVNRPCEDVLIEKCDFLYGHGGVAMGSETSGGIRNVVTQDCIMGAGNLAPIRFKTQPSRGGVVENIVYRNIVLKDTIQAFEFNMEWRMVNPKPASDPLPAVRNILIENVTGAANSVGAMHGLEGSPIQGVVFKNCKIEARQGFRLDNVKDLDLDGLKISVPEGVEPIVRRARGQAAAGGNEE